MAKVLITETALRDAPQSLIATRMTTREMLPVLGQLDRAGFYSLEAWGGATFDACIRFLNEDPWERLRKIRDGVRHTKLQMLFRGQNILGYRHYADDVVEYFVQKSAANGIDILRIFDALNDVRNLETSIRAAKREKVHVQAALSYTVSPVHDTAYFVRYAKQLEELGADSVCVKDMAGLLTPYTAYELVKGLKESLKIPVQVHSHCTSGLAPMSLLKAVEAGADAIDTAISPLSMGTSHPATESMIAALQGTPYDTGIDLASLEGVRAYFAGLRAKYLKNGLLDPRVLGVDANTLQYQVPGGMLSNLVSQLKQAGREDALDAVLAEVPRVRADAGYPPLVTPTSQIVGTQAVLNVVSGERYRMVSREFKALVRGEYGRTLAEISGEFRRRIIGGEPPVTGRPADALPPELPALRKEAAEFTEQEEDVLTYALFGQVAVRFFEKRRDARYGLDPNASPEQRVHPV